PELAQLRSIDRDGCRAVGAAEIDAEPTAEEHPEIVVTNEGELVAVALVAEFSGELHRVVEVARLALHVAELVTFVAEQLVVDREEVLTLERIAPGSCRRFRQLKLDRLRHVDARDVAIPLVERFLRR